MSDFQDRYEIQSREIAALKAELAAITEVINRSHALVASQSHMADLAAGHGHCGECDGEIVLESGSEGPYWRHVAFGYADAPHYAWLKLLKAQGASWTVAPAESAGAGDHQQVADEPTEPPAEGTESK